MEDLAREREQATFDINAMKIIWAGGKEAFEFHNKLASLVASDPVFQKNNRPRMTHKELFLGGIRKVAHCTKLTNELGLSEADANTLRILRDEKAYDNLHWNMFVPILRTQATPEQQKKWLPLATSMAIIGCYAQAELGHGSNVQGLETTATFDPYADEFILHSPTLSSTKWWPGGLGKVATHAIVHARLILDKDYGVHAFIVQIRSLEDHKPLTTITVGDIGQKFGNGGNNTVDNGFLRFNHTRIPRTNLLMRMAVVTREGKYVYQDVPKQILYGGMIAARQTILLEASVELSRAVAIAVRYSAVRRQFAINNANRETQVLDYMTQQHKLFPLLATAYAFRFVGQWMETLYSEVMSQFENNNFSALAEIHACTSGLKAITTSVTAEAIEKCRKACGGHGYLCSSGLPELFAAYIPACTYEGDNTLLYKQVGKFLVKTIFNMNRRLRPQGTTGYLADIDLHTTKDCEVSKGATVFLKSIDASGKTKNAEYLCGIMDEVIKDVGEENVVQIVTDNAANYVAAGKLLMERHPHLFWTPCAAHCIDLMLEDLGKLSWIKTVIERGRSVCKFIYNHTWVLNLMRKHNGQRELSRPGVTRFATNFLTLKSLLDSKGGLRRMFVSEEWLASSYATTTAGIAAADHIFDEPSFWTPIADIVTFVKPLIVLLRIADGEKPSMGYIYEGMDRVKEAIRTFFAGNQDRYGPIWDVIDRRWHNLLHRPIHAAAYFLNPAYQFSPHFKADDEVWSGLYDVVERMPSNSAVSTDIVREIELFKKAQGDLFARELCKKNRTALMPDDDWLNLDIVLDAFKARATRLLVTLSRNIQMFPNQDDGFEELSIDLVNVAEAHCQLMVLSKFVDKLKTTIPGLNVKQQLHMLCNIYGLSLICEHAGDFLATGYLTRKQASLASSLLRRIFSQVRPNAIALVDSFNHTDHYLGSALGCYDGDAYTHLYMEAMKDPFNNSDVISGYKDYIQPIIKQQKFPASKL